MLEKALESPLDCKEIKPVNPKGNQSWIFTGRTDTEAEAPILLPPAVKSRLIGKDPDAGKDCWWEEKGTTEDEMVGWRHWLNEREFSAPPGKPYVLTTPWYNVRVWRHGVMSHHYTSWKSGKNRLARCLALVFKLQLLILLRASGPLVRSLFSEQCVCRQRNPVTASK